MNVHAPPPAVTGRLRPVDLAIPCPQIAPMALIDPERAAWEADLLFAYAECAGKHVATVKAWNEALEKEK